MNNVIILGAGLSGLLASYKIRQAQIAKNVTIFERSNNIKHMNSTAAFYCHKFLNEELTPSNKRFNVKWQIVGETENSQYKYAMKVYGNQYIKTSIKNDYKKGWWLDVQRLIDITHINFDSKCTSINVSKKHIFFGKEKFEYDMLISTIPMPLFMKLSNTQVDFNFKSIPIYIEVEKLHSKITHFFDKEMRIQYFPDLSKDYYRKTYWQGNVTTESVLARSNSIATFPGKIFPIDNLPTLPYLKIMAEKDVYFTGRYARWEPKYLIHETFDNIIKEIK